MTPQEQIQQYQDLFKALLAPDEAGIYASSTGVNANARLVTIALDAAQLASNPFSVNFPFRSFVVLSTTDPSVSINMKLGTQDSVQDAFPVKNNYSLVLPFPVQKAFLDWSAQSGKTIQILFLLRGDFRSNQLVSSVAASVSITEGSAIASQTGAQVTSTAASLFAADTSRLKMIISNQDVVPIYLGDSTVTGKAGTKPGIPIQPGGSFEWCSTAACYAISDGASTGANTIGLCKFS